MQRNRARSIAWTAALALLLLAVPGRAEETDRTGTYYVTVSTLNVRLAPGTEGRISARLGRSEQVYVFEVKNGWGRISKYYDGSKDGLDGMIARWVAMRFLSRTPPGE